MTTATSQLRTGIRRFVTLFPDATGVHLNKDVGQIPRILAKQHGYISTLVTCQPAQGYFDNACPSGDNFQTLHIARGKRLLYVDVGVINYLLRESKRIDILNLYHATLATKIYTCLFKLLNPAGLTYIKLDEDEKNLVNIDATNNKKSFIRRAAIKLLDHLFLSAAHLVSGETRFTLDFYQNKYKKHKHKFTLIPNGVDVIATERYDQSLGYLDKENLIITVGRLGSAQKNVQLILEAIELTRSLSNWRVLLIGESTEAFDEHLAGKKLVNPLKFSIVSMAGQINCREELFKIYSRAKIFLLSSTYEGFPLVLPEAGFFGCIPIVTDVSSARDITKDGEYGLIVRINDAKGLAAAIESTVGDPQEAARKSDGIRRHIRENFAWDDIVSRLARRLTSAHV